MSFVVRESEIETCLVEIASLLQTYHRKYYANQVAGLASETQRANGHRGYTLRILYEIQSLYGGMGSLNDIYITQAVGDPIPPDDETVVNKKLQHLRARLYEYVADEIKLIESQPPQK